jgi:hypothetical protein
MIFRISQHKICSVSEPVRAISFSNERLMGASVTDLQLTVQEKPQFCSSRCRKTTDIVVIEGIMPTDRHAFPLDGDAIVATVFHASHPSPAATSLYSAAILMAMYSTRQGYRQAKRAFDIVNKKKVHESNHILRHEKNTSMVKFWAGTTLAIGETIEGTAIAINPAVAGLLFGSTETMVSASAYTLTPGLFLVGVSSGLNAVQSAKNIYDIGLSFQQMNRQDQAIAVSEAYRSFLKNDLVFNLAQTAAKVPLSVGCMASGIEILINGVASTGPVALIILGVGGSIITHVWGKNFEYHDVLTVAEKTRFKHESEVREYFRNLKPAREAIGVCLRDIKALNPPLSYGAWFAQPFVSCYHYFSGAQQPDADLEMAKYEEAFRNFQNLLDSLQDLGLMERFFIPLKMTSDFYDKYAAFIQKEGEKISIDFSKIPHNELGYSFIKKSVEVINMVMISLKKELFTLLEMSELQRPLPAITEMDVIEHSKEEKKPKSIC